MSDVRKDSLAAIGLAHVVVGVLLLLWHLANLTVVIVVAVAAEADRPLGRGAIDPRYLLEAMGLVEPGARVVCLSVSGLGLLLAAALIVSGATLMARAPVAAALAGRVSIAVVMFALVVCPLKLGLNGQMERYRLQAGDRIGEAPPPLALIVMFDLLSTFVMAGYGAATAMRLRPWTDARTTI